MSPELTRLEMALLNDAGVANDLSIAYGTVRLLERPREREVLCDLTGGALLKLFDLGLIMFFRAPRDEGYGMTIGDVTGLSRDEIVATLEADRDPQHIPDEDTDVGREVFEQLPSDAVPRPTGPTGPI